MLLSIGIPFYNAEETLMCAIQSVFAQTFQDWELILIDDGSTDSSLEIAQLINDSRVRVISDGTNKGLPHRLNQIANLANGKYLARMDADDIMHPERLERQIKFLNRNPVVDLVGAAAYLIDGGTTPFGIRGMGAVNVCPYKVISNGFFIHPTVIGRTEWFRENPYDEQFNRAEDRELWCRTFSKSRFYKLTEPLLLYRDGYSTVVNVRNYLNSCKAEYKIFLRYGPSLAGYPETVYLIIRTFVKSVIVRFLAVLGKQSILWRLKNTKISEVEKIKCEEIINKVICTKVPGMPL